MSGGKLKVWRCPVHGGQLTEGQRCRVVVKRTRNRITHCHETEEVEVVPAADLLSLEERLRKLRKALEPVAAMADRLEAKGELNPDDGICGDEDLCFPNAVELSVGDLKRVQAAYALPGLEEK